MFENLFDRFIQENIEGKQFDYTAVLSTPVLHTNSDSWKTAPDYVIREEEREAYLSEDEIEELKTAIHEDFYLEGRYENEENIYEDFVGMIKATLKTFLENWPEKNFKELFPNLDAEGIDLLQKFLQLEPDKRISAEEALKHPFFDDLMPAIKKLYNNE